MGEEIYMFHINALKNIYAYVTHQHTYTDKIFNVILRGFYLFNLGNFYILSVFLVSLGEPGGFGGSTPPPPPEIPKF
jgi:hypothetical protein